MLKSRLLVVLTINDGVLFRTKRFQPDYRYTLNFVDTWSTDEIVILDVTRSSRDSRANFLSVVASLGEKCFVPLTVGGGVRTLEDVEVFFRNGADKIVINTGALNRPEFISEVASAYGSQSVVVSIDAKKVKTQKEATVMSSNGAIDTGRKVKSWAREVESRGAGEILLTSVERDGSLEGLDIGLIDAVCTAVQIPVLALGGVGNWSHIKEAFLTTKVAGVCTQNIYHFTERSIKSAKKFLFQSGIAVRQ
jgi:imidazole glycerol-phosphate synthase subunit HisF